MTSTPRSDRPSSSLSESWATLSNSDVHSEDDWRSEHTDSASLIGRSVTDDVASLDEGDSESDGIDTDTDTESHCSEPQEFLAPLYPEANDDHDDDNEEDENENYRQHPAQASFLSTSDSIVFDEPEWFSRDGVEVKRTIDTIECSEWTKIYPELADHVPGSQFSVTVQQFIAKYALDVDKPFRVWYFGSQEFKPNILDKIGDVLVASPRNSLYSSGSGNSSRFHVVPASFGPDSTPNYAELLPIHVQLIVDEGTSATLRKQPNNKDTIILEFKNQTSIQSWFTGESYQMTNSTNWVDTPDVAIFFISDNDDIRTMLTRSLAEKFMRRHKVPCMVISEKPLWTKPVLPVPLDLHSPHIALEYRDPENGHIATFDRYPIDLKTFENIDPAQLNRGFASLAKFASSTWGYHDTEDKDFSKVSDVENYAGSGSGSGYPITGNAHDTAQALRFVMMTFLCLITLSLGYSAMKALIMILIQYFAGVAKESALLQGGNPFQTPTSFLPSSSSLRVVETSLQNAPKMEFGLLDCGVDEYILEVSQSADDKSADSNAFRIYVVGDCHVVLKVPASIATKKSPKFGVELTRAGTKVDFELSRLFDGVYALRLALEDAYGPMQLYMWTRTNPFIEQKEDIDFGTPWLKIASWKKSAQVLSSQLKKELNVAQTGLSKAYNRVRVDLQAMGDTLPTSRYPLPHVHKAATAMMRKSMQLSGNFKRGAIDRIAISSKSILVRAQSVGEDATELATGLWSELQNRANHVLQSKTTAFKRIHFKLQEMKRSRSLSRAQKRAWKLARNPCGRRKHASTKDKSGCMKKFFKR